MNARKVTVVVVITALLVLIGSSLVVWYFVGSKARTKTVTRPNIVIMLADDTGYADFQTYGHPTQEWTGVDRMAKEGLRFTQWNAGGVTCSPSRAALLTGRHPVRSGTFGSNRVFTPFSSGGLPRDEVTIAEALRDVGYDTGMVGKWHLGINEVHRSDGAHLPFHHGFDYVGTNLPQSLGWRCDPTKNTLREMASFCFLYHNDTIIEQPFNLKSLTSKLVTDTKTFLGERRENPFFFFLSFPQTHAPLFCDERFCGRSKRGLYGDNVNEMGWAVNEVLDQLIELGIEKDTLVLFLSDHGPVKDGCDEGGTAGMLRGGKGTTWEGGIRVPAVAWWPGTIGSETTSDTLVSTLDLFPTLLDLAGHAHYAEVNNITVDGKVITDVVKGKSDESPHQILFHYCGSRLMAVRYGKYKVHFATKIALDHSAVVHSISDKCSYRNVSYLVQLYGCEEQHVDQWDPPLVFDVEEDPAEQYSLDPTTLNDKLLLNKVKKLVREHKSFVKPGRSQIDRPLNFALIPCCDPPNCTCNYTEGALEVVEADMHEDLLHLPSHSDQESRHHPHKHHHHDKTNING